MITDCLRARAALREIVRSPVPPAIASVYCRIHYHVSAIYCENSKRELLHLLFLLLAPPRCKAPFRAAKKPCGFGGQGPDHRCSANYFHVAGILTILVAKHRRLSKNRAVSCDFHNARRSASGLQIQRNISLPTGPRIDKFLRNLGTRVVAFVIFTLSLEF